MEKGRVLVVVAAAVMMLSLAVMTFHSEAVTYTILWHKNPNLKPFQGKGKNIRGGDVVVFTYDKEDYNVIQVDKGSYDSCSGGGTWPVYDSGNDTFDLKLGWQYFICGTNYSRNCKDCGMKVAIFAHIK